MIYLDNNATTMMPMQVKKAMVNWCNRGNPSADYASAQDARSMMDSFRNYLGKLCEIDVNTENNPECYKILFTSGASEANCMILQSIVSSYAEITRRLPHIVISAIEHKSLLEMAKSYEHRGIASVTYIQPEPSGHILPENVESAIGLNTCIVCIMHANNETGAINNVSKIGAIAHKYNVPYHCDTVQTFNKYPINPIKNNIDTFCISFHKLHGPPGVGALVVRQRLLIGYRMNPMIFGTQNFGLRGGTENTPGLGASYAATLYTMENRAAKNILMQSIKKYIIDEIGSRIPSIMYIHYRNKRAKVPEVEVVFLSGIDDYLPNTILLSIVSRRRKICNIEIKKALEKKNIIISVGSACNTSSAKASHVLYAMRADELIRKGALRVSIGDNTTMKEAITFVKEFLYIIKKQLM